MEQGFTLYDRLMEGVGDVGWFVDSELVAAVSNILIPAFGIAVGFVAYKLIKRAINKA